MSARVGNLKLKWLMEDKQLECHPDKTGYVIMGGSQYKEEIRGKVNEEPIRFGSFITNEKKVEKYLGDLFSNEGLGAT